MPDTLQASPGMPVTGGKKSAPILDHTIACDRRVADNRNGGASGSMSIVTLTGTQGGPSAFIGVAGPGTLVRYGDRGNNCGAMILQFDAGEARPCV